MSSFKLVSVKMFPKAGKTRTLIALKVFEKLLHENVNNEAKLLFNRISEQLTLLIKNLNPNITAAFLDARTFDKDCPDCLIFKIKDLLSTSAKFYSSYAKFCQSVLGNSKLKLYMRYSEPNLMKAGITQSQNPFFLQGVIFDLSLRMTQYWQFLKI